MQKIIKLVQGNHQFIVNILLAILNSAFSYFSLILIAKTFGGTAGSDAYFYLVSLLIMSSGIVTVLFGVVMLPQYMLIREQKNNLIAGEFIGSILLGSLILALVILGLTQLYGIKFYELLSRFPASEIKNMYHILNYFPLLFSVSVMSEFFRAIALAHGRFKTSSLTTLSQPILLVCLLIFYSNALHEEILSISLLFSKTISLIVFIYVVVYKDNVKIFFGKNSYSHFKEYSKVSGPYFFANIISLLTAFNFDYLSSGLGVGYVTLINYAQKIYSIPINLVVIPILEIARTKFAKARAELNFLSFTREKDYVSKICLWLSVISAMLIFIFSHFLIDLLFGNSKFSTEDLSIVVNCLKIYSLGIPFAALFMVNGRAIESFQKLLLPSIAGSIGQFLTVVVSVFLTLWLGYSGIPLGKTIVDIVYFFPIVILLYKKLLREDAMRLSLSPKY
jgi:peptidoglycan biosynthesis protein MviN/MurJ (putative lipid II flippase)